jgi:hypothetical protein
MGAGLEIPGRSRKPDRPGYKGEAADAAAGTRLAGHPVGSPAIDGILHSGAARIAGLRGRILRRPESA